MWNYMEINWHLVTLFSIKYINILDGINRVSMSSHVNDKTMTVSIRTIYISDLDINVLTQKSELPQGNFLGSLVKPETTRQRTFEPTEIEYDQIKDEISRMERVDYNNDIKRNVINVDYIEDFVHL